MQRLLTVKEVSEALDIPIGTIRYWLAKGKCTIPFKKMPNGRIVVTEDALVQWILTVPRHRGVTE